MATKNTKTSKKQEASKISPASGKKKSSNSSSTHAGRSAHESNFSVMILIFAAVLVLLAFFLQMITKGSSSKEQTEDASPIRLNELVSSNLSTLLSPNGDASDWIEIKNTGTEKADITGYSLFLSSSVSNMYVFPKRVLEPGEFVIIYADSTVSNSETAPFGLPASGDNTLILINSAGSVVDSVDLPELDRDYAYARTSDGEWAVTSEATPGKENVIRDGTPASASAKVPDMVESPAEITEIMTSNTLYLREADGSCSDYIEIHNTSSSTLDLNGWYLSDNISSLKKWKFPSVKVQPDGYIVVKCVGSNAEKTSELCAGFAMPKLSCSVYLSRPDGKPTSGVSVPALQANQAYSLVGGKWSTEIAPTPGRENTAAAAAQINSSMFNSPVIISEIMASPVDRQYDWIELYNSGSQPIDISGWGLSDDASKPRKFQFPNGTTIQSGEYKCVYLSGTDSTMIETCINVNFSLPAEGGNTISLSSPSGVVTDAVYVPCQYSGISYGRVSGTSQWRFFEGGTFGGSNSGNGYAGRAPSALCSNEGGLFKSGDTITVTLSSPEGGQIYYTTDCSDPTTTSRLYTGPITITSTTILRTRVFTQDYLESYISTHSYIFDSQTKDGVYVVSLVSDSKNLTDPQSGIMTNYREDWEREGSFELFTADGKRVLGSECGLSLHGADSRELPVKAFNLIARSRYGNASFDYPVFKERDYTSYKSLLLRPSGEDYNMSFMRDTLLTSLMKDTSVMYQKWELCICYLNGEYYTLYYIRERITPESICQFEGWEGMEDDLDLIKGKTILKQGSADSFNALLEYVKTHDTTDDSVFRVVENNIDTDNYIEYMAIEIFSGNTDLMNIRKYRNPKADGKWHFALFDLDWAFFSDTDSIGGWLDPSGTGVKKMTDTTLFIACMKNAGFRDRFLTYFGEKMATTFSAENVMSKIQERTELLIDLIPDYMAKWNANALSKGVAKLKNYALTRPVKLLGTYFPNALRMSDADIQKYFGEAVEVNSRYLSSIQN